MKNTFLVGLLLLACPRSAWAIYGPSLARANVSIAQRACQEAGFPRDPGVAETLRDGRPDAVLKILGYALKEWRSLPPTSDLYPARAFCLHELVPAHLPAKDIPPGPDVLTKTATALRFEKLGIEYFYYGPDGDWVLRENPVDLRQLSSAHSDSPWGRQAFLMMTQLGWSDGTCQEGPDQFREVIKQGESFLRDHPHTEVSDDVRLEVANAYATWWNISREEPNPPYSDPAKYKTGADKAKIRAISLYQEYLRAQKNAVQDVQSRMKALRENPKGSNHYEYFCEDYED